MTRGIHWFRNDLRLQDNTGLNALAARAEQWLPVFVLDRRLLRTLIERYEGGPAGIDALAAAIGESRDTLEDVIEPYLVQQGYLLRTPRGRVAGAPAWRQLGLEPPPTPRGASLFDQNA